MSEGKKIREFRERKDISITELARRIGVSRSYLSRMETGERPIKTEMLVQIAKVLDVSIQDFYPEDKVRKIEKNGEEIFVIDKKRHKLDEFTEEEILEFIRLGLEQAKKNVD